MNVGEVRLSSRRDASLPNGALGSKFSGYMRAVIAILVVICLVLGGALLMRHKKALETQQRDETKILQLSNQWVDVSGKLSEQQKVNIALETDLTNRTGEISSLSNKLSDTSANLSKVESDYKVAQEEIAKKDARISQLTSEKDELTSKMGDLNTSIENLEGQIKDTEKKLAASEGDREFLLKELKRLQAEKAELERQFNDMAVLREQVRKLRDELSISRRLDWIRRGLYGITAKGGAERLQNGFPQPAPGPTNYNLDVEIKREGGARILPSTNAPPVPPPPPQTK
jgi:septal ring factor EnvC (AmiA/AmiB activator)